MKYLFFDLDGTLLDSRKQVSVRTVEYLQHLHEERGIVVGIATGRGITGILPLIKDNHMEDAIQVIVANDGGDLIDRVRGMHIRHHYVTTEEIRMFLERFQKEEKFSVTFHNPDHLYANRYHFDLDRIVRLNRFQDWRSPYEYPYEETARIVVLHPDENLEYYHQILHGINFKGFRGSVAEPHIYNYVHEDVSKADTIREYVESLGDSMDEVMAIGDGENDREMLEASGISVSMKNGVDILKEISDIVTEYNNDEEGVYHFLKNYFEKEDNMSREEVVMRMKKTGIFAVVRVETVERGLEIAEGCLNGGVDVMEVSYTNANAGDVIRAIKEKFGDKMCVGAGTVLDGTTARLAIMNGAQFMVAPNFDADVQTMCNLYQIPYGPGCTTYTEMINALKAGASFIKAFPISNYYGPNLAKVFKVPCPQIPILASGNVTPDNIAEWVKNGAEYLGVGTLLTKGTPEEITKNAIALRAAFEEAKGA